MVILVHKYKSQDQALHFRQTPNLLSAYLWEPAQVLQLSIYTLILPGQRTGIGSGGGGGDRPEFPLLFAFGGTKLEHFVVHLCLQTDDRSSLLMSSAATWKLCTLMKNGPAATANFFSCLQQRFNGSLSSAVWSILIPGPRRWGQAHLSRMETHWALLKTWTMSWFLSF